MLGFVFNECLYNGGLFNECKNYNYFIILLFKKKLFF